MEIDKDGIVSQEETNEEAPMDIATERAEAEIARMKKAAKEEVSEELKQQDID